MKEVKLSWKDRVEADRRLCILKVLVENGGAASESTIEHALLDLGERVGLDRSVVCRLLVELEARECIVVDKYRDQVMVAQITKFGVAVSEGRMTADGVSKPSLGI